MANDSTELTFVRCPSCRSLVPAMSTRCRMCGATLDAGAEEESPTAESDKSSRVRQRTMSKPGDVLASVADEVRRDIDDSGSEMQADSSQGSTKSTGLERSSDDPLGAYVEEVAVDSASSGAAKKDQGAPKQEAKSRKQGKSKEKVQSGDSNGHQRQKNDRGPRFRSKSSGLSFAKSKDGGEKDRFRPQRTGSDKLDLSAERPKDSVKQSEKDNKDQSEAAAFERKDVMRADKEKAGQDKRPKAEARSEKVVSEPAPPQTKEPSPTIVPKAKTGQKGRLYGWFVNYADGEGSAIEIREGQFFVTNSSLKESDLVIDHESISTPHALVRADINRGLEIQDLMSERGLFVRARNSDVYGREEDRVELNHGDWVRFGDVEFLLCLVAHVGE